jgi:hypothetical protein
MSFEDRGEGDGDCALSVSRWIAAAAMVAVFAAD